MSDDFFTVKTFFKVYMQSCFMEKILFLDYKALADANGYLKLKQLQN